LTWPVNRHIITKIKTSITAGIRPCAMIFHEQPSDAWTRFDFLLLVAYQMLQDEICPKCGHPVWLCRSSSNRVQFKVRAGVCYAERSLREYEDQHKPKGEREKDRKARQAWGQFFYTQPFVPENVEGELPTRAEFYAEFNQSTVE
jgi:Zn-finger nucleic acid-binding protein